MKKVRVILTNRQAYIKAGDSVLEKLDEFYSYSKTGAYFTYAYKLRMQARLSAEKKAKRELTYAEIKELPGWDGKQRFLKDNVLPSGLFRGSYTEAEKKLNLKFDIGWKLPEPRPFKFGLHTDDEHKYQAKCADAMCAAVPYGGGCVTNATGTGKTRIAAVMFSRVSYACLFVVDQVDLLYQQRDELESWLGEKVGVVGDSEFEVQRVTVATSQTLHLRRDDDKFLDWYRSIKIVIVDELHEQMGRRNFSILKVIKPIARFGLTATLQLKKKSVWMRAYSFAGPVIYSLPLKEAVKKGVLSEGKALQLLFPSYTEEYGKMNYQDQYVEEVIEHEVKRRAIVKVTEELTRDRFVIHLAERRPHIEALSELLGSFRHKVAYGPVPRERRRKAISKMEKGKLRLIIASRVFKKGINVKRVDAIVDLAEGDSIDDTQQKYGRGVRLHPDKTGLVYVDFGTYDTEVWGEKSRFTKRANHRARALRALGVNLKRVKVTSAKQALKVLQKWLNRKSNQMELFT